MPPSELSRRVQQVFLPIYARQWRTLMISTVINSLRVFKGLYDLAFSEDQFYVGQRAEFLGGVRHYVEQAKEGYHNPPPPQVYDRKPSKVLLGILIFALFLPVLIGGQ